MQVDRYTKIMLTAIAAGVWTLIIVGASPARTADQFGPTNVRIVGVDNTKYSDVLSIRLVSIDEAPSLLWKRIPVQVR